MGNYETEAALAKELGIPTTHACVVGSTLICGSGNDVDVLALVPAENYLTSLGFIPDLEVEYESPLRSFRREGLNIIATTDPRFFFAEVAIAHSARMIAADKFDMTLRDERIRFHSAVRDEIIIRLAEVI